MKHTTRINPSSAAMDPTIRSFSVTHPIFESQPTTSLIAALNLAPHIEGGYFVETDRDPLLIPNPFLPPSHSSQHAEITESIQSATRNASTTIFYLLTPRSPFGSFHRNKGRTVHTLHKGRGTYVVIHPDGSGGKGRVETFRVGEDVENGERLQWIVEGGKWKASFLGEGEEGLLISEVRIAIFL